MKNQRWFETLHPLVILAYLGGGMGLGFASLHPVYISVMLVCAVAMNLWLRGLVQTERTLMRALVLFCLVVLLNAVFNDSGATTLCFFLGRPVTLEALTYGLVSGEMLMTMWLWCAIWQTWMTNERFLYLFGNWMPTLSLLLSMVFALIPQSGHKLARIRLCQSYYQGQEKKRKIQQLIRQISCLLVMDMEDSMQTADAMRCKGYGSGKRTTFSLYSFTVRDGIWLVVVLASLAVSITAAVMANAGLFFYPWRSWRTIPPLCLVGMVGFMLLPILMQTKEWFAWKRCR